MRRSEFAGDKTVRGPRLILQITDLIQGRGAAWAAPLQSAWNVLEIRHKCCGNPFFQFPSLSVFPGSFPSAKSTSMPKTHRSQSILIIGAGRSSSASCEFDYRAPRLQGAQGGRLSRDLVNSESANDHADGPRIRRCNVHRRLQLKFSRRSSPLRNPMPCFRPWAGRRPSTCPWSFINWASLSVMAWR